MSAQASTHHESLWLHLDPDLLRDLDALARTKGITRHEAARVAMRLGVEMVRRRAEGPR